MRRLSLAALAAAASLGAACTDAPAPGPTIAFREPAALAAFRGKVADASDPAAQDELRPYFAIANAARNDLTIIDARDDGAVQSPIQLRALVYPVAARPTLLAAASLGDGGADLLVAVSGGDSVLQVVETWNATPVTLVHSDPATGPAVDLGSDVRALVALPSAPGTARVAAALAGRQLAVVEWARVGADGSIASVGAPRIAAFPAFDALDLAALPGDPALTEIYAATLDDLGGGVFGVAAIPPDLSGFRALDARGPTRLVAAARLKERVGTSTASDATAFAGAEVVSRVYAVLDESGCGRNQPIDCGVVTLDPVTNRIPDDWAGLMPYRAPMRVTAGSRISAIAIAMPPAFAPADAGDPYVDGGEFMRLFDGTTARATTAVAAVAADGALGGDVFFLDLGRFETGVTLSPVASRNSITLTSEVSEARRLFPVARDASDVRSFPASEADAAATLTVTPGFTPNDTFTVAYQGFLPRLTRRNGEAGLEGGAGSELWLALQRGDGPPAPGRAVTDVVRLFHPALGVLAGDTVVVKAAAVPGCLGTAPVTIANTVPVNGEGNEFEVEIAAVLEPTDFYPGGAVRLVRPAPPEPQEWVDCFDALRARIDAGGGATGLDVAFRAGGLLLSGNQVGYAGRPVLGARYTLEYPADQDEDALAGLCPLADWDGSLPPPTCGGGACARGPGTDCEKLVLARKVRRLHNLSFPCEDDACRARFPGVAFPEGNGPALALEVDVQGGCTLVGANVTCDPSIAPPRPEPVRGAVLTISTQDGIQRLASRPSTGISQASGAISFDRSPEDRGSGYRFVLSYPGDLVVDVSPHVDKPSEVVLR